MKKITLLLLMLISYSGFAQFPLPYCGPMTFTSNVEPITLVNFAGINNSSSATVGANNGTTIIAHEDYTSIIGNVTAGSSYAITLKGNTDGNYTTYLRVYIDWNQNNDFTDAGESYDIGTIANSTGADAIQLVGNIQVPATALTGNTRMRVIKRFNAYGTSCQTGTGYGQAEDYTLTVAPLPPDLPDYANLQFPYTATINQGQSVTVYGQVYEGGLTDVAPNITGQAPGIQAWVGYSTTDTNPNTWTNWVAATWNSGMVGNNDEYQANIGSNLTPGTYYYATRFQLNGGAFVYGGTNFGFWNGTDKINGVLTVNPPLPPANDECSGAISLTVNPSNVCTVSTSGTILGATASTVDAAACGGTEDDDVWFSFVATSTSHYINLNNVAGSTTDLYHSLWTGADCNSLTLVPNTCSDPNNSTPTGLTIGQTYYLRVYSFGAVLGQTSTFDVCIGTPPPAPSNDDCSGAVALTLGTAFADYAVTGSLLSSTSTSGITPSCQTTVNSDVWYSVVVPTSGNLTIETQTTATNTLTDTVVVAFSGTCGSLVPVGCDDDGGPAGVNNLMSLLNLTGQTPGSTLYIGVWKYGATAPSATVNGFKISAYETPLSNNTFDSANFSYYPNPVKNNLNLSYNQEISNVEIFNLMGQKVSSNTINANQAQIDMSYLASGAYLVRVTSNNQVKTIRVIKE